jgi:hypothetical protein
MLFELEPGQQATDVVLTIGYDALDHPLFTSIGADTEPTGNLLFSEGKPERGKIGMVGAAYYSIRQGFISGDALAIHDGEMSVPSASGFAGCDVRILLVRVLSGAEMRAVILTVAVAVGLGLGALSGQAAPLAPAPTSIERGTAPPIELVDHACGVGLAPCPLAGSPRPLALALRSRTSSTRPRREARTSVLRLARPQRGFR